MTRHFSELGGQVEGLWASVVCQASRALGKARNTASRVGICPTRRLCLTTLAPEHILDSENGIPILTPQKIPWTTSAPGEAHSWTLEWEVHIHKTLHTYACPPHVWGRKVIPHSIAQQFSFFCPTSKNQKEMVKKCDTRLCPMTAFSRCFQDLKPHCDPSCQLEGISQPVGGLLGCELKLSPLYCCQ